MSENESNVAPATEEVGEGTAVEETTEEAAE